MKILGLDLSLTSTGRTLIDFAPDGTRITTARVRSTGKKGATPNQTGERLERLLNGILPTEELAMGGLSLAVIESPSHGSTTPGQHERAGLWWRVACRLEEYGIPIATVAPSTLKVYALGVGKGEKDQVLAAVIRRYADLNVSGNDIADSVLLAAMGARYRGMAIDGDLAQTCLRAMKSAKWPE